MQQYLRHEPLHDEFLARPLIHDTGQHLRIPVTMAQAELGQINSSIAALQLLIFLQHLSEAREVLLDEEPLEFRKCVFCLKLQALPIEAPI